MSRSLPLSLIALSLLAASGLSCSSPGGADAGWALVWSDEFDGEDGAPPDPTKWAVLLGGDGWGNAEREYYTADPMNLRQEGGALLITASTEGIDGKMCWYGPCTHTSARIETKGTLEQLYGRFEGRIQIPRGQGMWPAFWMLGVDRETVGWPKCGEIDIMENVGFEPKLVHGTLHGPGYSGGGALSSSYALPSGEAFAADYHLYAVEWTSRELRFYVDDVHYATRSAEDLPSGAPWVFDHPFHLLLNLAVGGNWPGDPDSTTVFPATMKVDYVRVYVKE